MTNKKESTTKKIGRFIGKKAVDAGNIIDKELRKGVKIARDEFKDFDIGNIVVEPTKKPKDESRVEFTRRIRPTKTYTQANRTVQFFSRNPEKKEMNPGIDGLVSFSILLAPFAVILGILLLYTNFDEFLAISLFLLYVLLIAIPGAYLGLDAIFAGARSVIRGGTTTAVAIVRGFAEFVYLLLQGLLELFILTFNSLVDYIVFVIVYVFFAGGIWIILLNLQLELKTVFILGFLVLIPSLLPASIAHRYWVLWKLGRESKV